MARNWGMRTGNDDAVGRPGTRRAGGAGAYRGTPSLARDMQLALVAALFGVVVVVAALLVPLIS